MKHNLIHICFVIDESGSMYDVASDVIGGFKSLIDEQSKVEGGECLVSLYRFSSTVTKSFIGKSVKDVRELKYNPGGSTAMNDGIGTAIDEIGKWLSNMSEEERPSKNMIVIMTDGEENSSFKYSLEQVKNKIEHQTNVYNWTFIYMGCDISNLNDANKLGINNAFYAAKSEIVSNYSDLNTFACNYRNADSLRTCIDAEDTLLKTYSAKSMDYISKNNISK